MYYSGFSWEIELITFTRTYTHTHKHTREKSKSESKNEIIYFKELAHMIVGVGKIWKYARQTGRVASQGKTDVPSWDLKAVWGRLGGSVG